LARYFDDLDLDIDCSEVLAERVDLNQAWIDRSLESEGLLVYKKKKKGERRGDEPSKSRNQSDSSLFDGLEGVRAADAAGDRSEETETFTHAVD
jgi:hypothetical protein